MIGSTQTVIVYSSGAEMLIDQSLMTGEFFAVFSGIIVGFFAFVMTQIVLRGRAQRLMVNRFWRGYGLKPKRQWLPSNEVIGLVVGVAAGIAWSTWLLGKI